MKWYIWKNNKLGSWACFTRPKSFFITSWLLPYNVWFLCWFFVQDVLQNQSPLMVGILHLWLTLLHEALQDQRLLQCSKFHIANSRAIFSSGNSIQQWCQLIQLFTTCLTKLQVRNNTNLGKNAQKEQLSMHKKISSQLYGDDGTVGELKQ